MIETRYLLPLIAVIGAAITPGRPCCAQEDGEHQAVLDRIFADWERRREAMDAVEYRLEGTEMVPKGSYTEDLITFEKLPRDTTEEFPPEDRTFDIEYRFVFDFARNRMRVERRSVTFYVDYTLFAPSFEIRLCDGENLQDITPRAENTSAEFTPLEYQTDFRYLNSSQFWMYFMDAVYEPFLMAHGRPPLFDARAPNDSGMGFQRYTRPIERAMFRWHADASLDGRDCTVLRTINLPQGQAEHYYEYWVDVERDSAVMRYVFNTGELVEQLDVDHQQSLHGWLPAAYRHTTAWRGGTQLNRYYEVRVTQIIADPPLTDEMFHATPEPGMVVRDDRTDEERYVYAGPGKPNVNWREHRIQKLRAAQEPRPTRWVAIGIIGAVIAVGLIVHRLRAAR